MPEFSKISKYVDEAGLQKDTSFFLSQLTAIETAALSTANKIKTALGTFGTQAAGSTQGTKQAIQGMHELSLTTANYTKILAAVGLEIDSLTDAQKANLKQVNEAYKVEEQARQGSKETVKLIQTEIQQTERLSAGRTTLAQTLANNNAQIKAEKLERDRLARVLVTENNSREKAQAIIDLLINKGKKLNLETEQGKRVNDAYNKTIEKMNAFLLANNDVESNRLKNIGNYNAAAKIVVDAMEKEQIKLRELIATREKYNSAGSVKPVAGFGRGNTGNDTTASAGSGPTSKAGNTGYAEIGKDAEFAQQKVEELDKQIEQSRTVIEGFNRASKELPITKATDNADKEVKALTASLEVLETNGLGATGAADQLKKKIAELTGTLQRAEAATSALDLIQKEIADLDRQLAASTKGSPKFELLTKQIAMLKGVATGLDRTFGKSTQELRALEEGAKKIATTFGVASAQFQKFSKIAGERKDQLKDVQNALKFQASDTKGLDATLQGVQAITGAYGAYQAVVALTGEENKELEKSMQRLQAITALVVSVQGIANALQSDSALIQGGLAVKNYALAAAQKLLSAAIVETSVALAAETTVAATTTASMSTLAVAEQAAGVASLQLSVANGTATLSTASLGTASAGAATGLGAAAAGATGLTAGLGGVVVAEAAVATGATAMASAIAATGIGLIVIALAAAVYKLVTALQEQNRASASTRKANEALAGSMKSLTEATKVYEDLSRQSTNRQLADMDRLIAKRKALGVSATTALAMDLKAAQEKEKFAAEEVRLNGITLGSLKKQEVATLVAAGTVRAAEKLKLDYLQQTINKQDENYDKQIELFDANITFQKSRFDQENALYERSTEMYNRSIDTKQERELLYNQAVKLAGDERRKFIQESAKIEAELIIAGNDEVLNNERSTLEKRIAALQGNLAQRKKIIAADNAAVQNDPTTSGVDKKLAAKAANAELEKIETESNIAIAQLKEEFRLRDLAAEQETSRLLLGEVVETNEAILANEKMTEAERLEALAKSMQARKLILDSNVDEQLANAGISDADAKRIKETGFFEIANKKITNQELKSIIEQYNSEVGALTRDSAEQMLQIQRDYYTKYAEIREDALRDIELENKLANEDRTDTYNNDIIALNNALQAGQITQAEYTTKRLQTDKDYQKDSLEIQLATIEKSLAATERAVNIEKKLQEELNALKNFTGPEDDEQKRVRGERIAAITEELEIIKQTIGEESELYAELSALKRELSDGDTDNFITNQEKLVATLEKVQAVANQVFSAISGVTAGMGEREKQRLQDQIDGIELRTERELAANESLQQSEEKKAENTLRINARAQAQKEELEKRQKKVDRDRAVADKAMSIFQIILATTVNIAKAKDPFSKVLAAITGAAQLAIAVATPIPKFKRGLFNDYIGYAWVGDGGKKEVIKRKTGQIEVTPATDTLTYINQGDRIEPDADQYFAKMQGHAMANVIKQTAHKPISQADYGKHMADAYERQTGRIIDAIKGQSHLNMDITEQGIVSFWQHGANRTSYMDEQTNWS